MTVAFQASLFDASAEFALGDLERGLTRVELTHGAWLEVRPGWLTGADALFERLAAVVPWSAERRRMYDNVVTVPRLLCYYDASFGNPRALLLRSRDGGPTLRYDLGHGDLLVMGGTCQRTWLHGVPKTRRPVGPRISVQFRPRGVR